MHGLTEQDFQNALKEAQEAPESVRGAMIATVQTTKEIVELFELDHLRSPGELLMRVEMALDKARMNAEMHPAPGPVQLCRRG